MGIYVGVPVLRRYDLLRELLVSLEAGTVKPDKVMIIDNGKNGDALSGATLGISLVEVYTPVVPLGVAASWNWLIDNLPEERIITNDDITFSPDAVERMCETPGDLVFGHGYSCYLIRNSAIVKIGRFDEAISPGYAYWEDIDYDMRARLAVRNGIDFVQVNAPCTVHHGGSRTNAVATEDEIQDHHRKFMLAQRNFIEKWAHLPPELRHPAIGGPQ